MIIQVLIPPGTATMYEQLLKLEKYEVTKKSVNWPRVIEIRRLKDRMVRKCQKLARAIIPPPDSLSPFQTCIASKDFRVKEMEKWFREQQKRANAAAVKRASKEPVSNTPVHVGLGPNSTNPRYFSGAFIVQPVQSNTQYPTTPIPKSRLGLCSRVQANAVKLERSVSLPVSHNQVTHSSTRPSVVSPPPLPILLRGQRSQLGLEEELGQVESALDDSEFPESSVSGSPPPPRPKEVPVEQKSLFQSSPQSSGYETLSHNPNRTVIHRSCIKRTNEVGTKTVSWADDHDSRVSRYVSAAQDAQASGMFFTLVLPGPDIYLGSVVQVVGGKKSEKFIWSRYLGWKPFSRKCKKE